MAFRFRPPTASPSRIPRPENRASPVSCLVVLFIAIGLLLTVFGISAYVQYATLRIIDPVLASGSLGVALALGFSGIFLMVFPPAFVKLLLRKTDPRTDDSFPDGVRDLPPSSLPPPAISPPPESDTISGFSRTGDPSPLPTWVKTPHQTIEELHRLNERSKAHPQLSLKELSRRLKSLEIRVGKLQKRVIRNQPLEPEELLDSLAIEEDVRSCLLEALEESHAKGEVSEKYYQRKYAQLKPVED